MLTNQQKRLLSFFLRYPEKASVMIHQNYVFPENFLQRYRTVIDWYSISRNAELFRQTGLVEKFRDYIDWTEFSDMQNYAWTEEFVHRYRDYINWSTDKISAKGNLPRSSFWANRGFRWTIPLVEKYMDRMNWTSFQMNMGAFWTEQMIEKYADKIDWEVCYPGIAEPMSIEFVDRFITKFGKPWFNFGMTEDRKLIEKYSDIVNWDFVSISVQLEWTKEFMDKWFHKLNMQFLAGNPAAISNLDNFEYFHDKCDVKEKYIYLSSNHAAFWTEELIEKYSDEWDWNHLSENRGLPWTSEFLRKYRSKWHYGKLKFTDRVYHEWEDVWYVGLSLNKGVPWTLSLVEEFEDDLNPEFLFRNSAIWHLAFRKYTSEELVELFFRIHY